MLAKKKWAGSMRWRIVLIYFLLVFIALTIVSVFIINQLEAYQLNSLRTNLTRAVNETNLLTSLAQYDNLMDHQAEIQKSIDEGWEKSFQETLSIVDKDLIVVASTIDDIVGQTASKAGLEVGILTNALGGNIGEKDGVITGNIPVKNLAYPIGDGDEITGFVYVRADLASTYDFLSQSKSIFVRAMVLALLVTVVLGFLIARSITVPINDVTEKAERMSQGDFSQEVSVKSDDEIGRLAEMFNLLRKKLDFTLSEISNEKSKLETILQYMADGLIAIDLKGTIIHANPAALQMLDLTEADIEAKNYEDILGRLDDNLKLDYIKEHCEKEGGQDIFDYGSSIFAARYDRFKDEDGDDVGIIMIIQDITERQKLENMQTDFVANVSHELKTPLTTIKSYTETLLDGAADDPELTRNFLGIVDAEADRMNRLVKDLLQLSRIDHQQEKWYMKESNLTSLLKSTVTKIEMTAKMKQQHLNCLFDPDRSVMVIIDKDRIEQVILNIISNSIKYTDEGGRIDIDVVTAERQAKIIVADNGIGMAESELPRIFERFYRVDKARSRAMGGTGLGLAIAKQIVEEHNGTIELESQEGKGTKVTIALPLAVRRGISNIE